MEGIVIVIREYLGNEQRRERPLNSENVFFSNGRAESQ